MRPGPHDGRAYVRLYAPVTTNQNWQQSFIQRADHIDYASDILFLNGINVYHTGFKSALMPISAVTGIRPELDYGNAGIQFLTDRPQNIPWSSGDDWNRYGSILNALNAFDTGQDEPLAHLKEKQVVHRSYRGFIGDALPQDIFHANGTFGGVYTQAPWHVKYPSLGFVDAFEGVDFSADGHIVYQSRLTPEGESSLTGFNIDAFDYIKRTVELLKTEQVVFTKSPFYLRYSNVVDKSTRSYNGFAIDLEYDYQMEAMPGWGGTFATYHVSIRCDITFSPVSSTGGLNPFDVLPIKRSVLHHTQDNKVTLVAKHPDVTQALPSDFIISFGERLWSYTEPYQVGPEFTSKMNSFRYSNGRRPIDEVLENNVNHHMKDIRPSSFLAASDGLEQEIEVLKSNNLENLSQLEGALSFLPDLAEIAAVIAKATRGDPSAIKDLVDIIADAILQFKFGTKPTVDDGSEAIATDIASELAQLLRARMVTVHGKFRYEFLDSENFVRHGKLVLDTRSKVRFRLDMSTLMIGYLTANSVGLLPTLSRVWALLPFSFVVDWFTNMSERLQAVDDQLLWLTLRVAWALHSYKVTWYPDDEYLESFGLVSLDPDDQFGITVYLREFSRITPRLSESRFDFLRPTHGPDPVTVGALIWQFIK